LSFVLSFGAIIGLSLSDRVTICKDSIFSISLDSRLGVAMYANWQWETVVNERKQYDSLIIVLSLKSEYCGSRPPLYSASRKLDG